MNRALSVLHVIQGLSLGGATRSLLAVAGRSARGGAVAHTLLPLNEPGPGLRARAGAAGLVVETPPDADATRALVAEADVVHLHFWNTPELYAWLDSDLPPMRLLLFVHVAGDRPPHVLTSDLVAMADAVVAGSPYTYDLPVLRERAEDVALIADTCELAPFLDLSPRPHAGFRVGYVGTVDFVKMHPAFVATSARVRIRDAHFVVCGPGGAWAALRAEAARLGASDRFEWRGYATDVLAVLAELDVFGYPLCEDNYSGAELALQEAMAAGVPPVVLPYGGAARMVDHGRTGLVARTLDEYVQAIESLRQRPDVRVGLAAAARAHAREQFGAERVAPALDDLYRRLRRHPKRPLRWVATPATAPSGVPAAASGAWAFVRSLGGRAPEFASSLGATDTALLLDAERRIARASPGLANPGAGGVLHYRHHYPDDPYLRLWAGLALAGGRRYALAAAEFAAALTLGLDHWRVRVYLGVCGERAGAPALAGRAVAPHPSVRASAPAIERARAVLEPAGIATAIG